MSLLIVSEISSGYGELEIIHNVSISVNKGEIVSIIGPNGCGKSTLMKTVFGLLKPYEGEIDFKYEEITALTPDQIVRKGMSYVPQEYNVFPSLTVEENLEMGAFIKKSDNGEQITSVYDLFPPLKGMRKRRVGCLSGGEKQMVALGMAMMLEPDLLLLDEPSAGLAPKLIEVILDKVNYINEEANVAILMVEQNARKALEMSNRGYVLAMGEKRFEDTGESLLKNSEVGKLYLGG